MQALALRRGDLFVEVATEDWARMTTQERKRVARVTAESPAAPCTALRDRVHLRTSRGSWCIPGVAPVTLLTETASQLAEAAA